MNSTKLAKLHHTHNGIYEALRSASHTPEPLTSPKAQKPAEGAVLRPNFTTVSRKHFV